MSKHNNEERLWLTDDERYELAKKNNRLLRAQKAAQKTVNEYLAVESSGLDPTEDEWKQIFMETVAYDDNYNIVIR